MLTDAAIVARRRARRGTDACTVGRIHCHLRPATARRSDDAYKTTSLTLRALVSDVPAVRPPQLDNEMTPRLPLVFFTGRHAPITR
jgi:hypothetical protein